jgi:type II secretory pathway pseudopilin PulG
MIVTGNRGVTLMGLLISIVIIVIMSGVVITVSRGVVAHDRNANQQETALRLMEELADSLRIDAAQNGLPPTGATGSVTGLFDILIQYSINDAFLGGFPVTDARKLDMTASWVEKTGANESATVTTYITE